MGRGGGWPNTTLAVFEAIEAEMEAFEAVSPLRMTVGDRIDEGSTKAMLLLLLRLALLRMPFDLLRLLVRGEQEIPHPEKQCNKTLSKSLRKLKDHDSKQYAEIRWIMK